MQLADPSKASATHQGLGAASGCGGAAGAALPEQPVLVRARAVELARRLLLRHHDHYSPSNCKTKVELGTCFDSPSLSELERWNSLAAFSCVMCCIESEHSYRIVSTVAFQVTKVLSGDSQ